MKKLIILFVIIVIIIPVFSVQAAVTNVASNITVNEAQIIKASDKRLLGFNDDAAWRLNLRLASGSSKMDDSKYDAIKSYGFNIPIIRGFFHYINWKDTIGAPNERGYDTYSAPYSFGMVEWIDSIKKITKDVEFVITVNINDSVNNIKDLVRFLTLNPDDSEAVDENGVNWAQKRIDLGLTEPVKVACFELGNETDMLYHGTSAQVAAGAAEYISLCSSLIDGIKDVNNNAKVSVLTYTTPQDNTDNYLYWNPVVIANLGSKVDYIVSHYYYHSVGNMGYYMMKKMYGTQIMQYINLLSAEKRPKLYLSEHAVYVDPTMASTEFKVVSTSLQGALTTAEVVNRMSNSADFGLATYHSLFGNWSTPDHWGGDCWGVLRPYRSGELMLSAVGEYFKMAYDAFGVNNVQVTCSGNAYCTDATSGYGNQILTASAHTTAEGGLNLILVNQNPSVGHNITFSANKSYKLEKETFLRSDDILGENMPDEPEKVVARTNLINDENVFSTYYMPPQSITVLYLVPMEKELSDINMEIELNGVIADAEVPTVICKNRRLEADCLFYNNRNMSSVGKVVFMILKEGANLDNISAQDILYLDQKDTVRQRAHFECTIPMRARAGRYLAYIANKDSGDDCYKTVAFDYEPSYVEDGLIQDIKVNDAQNNDYRISLIIKFMNGFADQKDFLLKVINSSTGETVYIEQVKKQSANQPYSFYMPREAISGEYTLIVGYEQNGIINSFAKTFDFVKPMEIVKIQSVPINQSGSQFTFADFLSSGSMTIALKNISYNPRQLYVFLAVYNSQGGLIKTLVGNQICMSPNETANYTLSYSAMQPGTEIGAVKAYVWDSGNISPLTDFYIVKW